MATKVRKLEVYEELAGCYDRQGQAKLRDWFLVLAADTAVSMGQHEDAERLRRRLLHANPHHMLRLFPSFAQALKAAEMSKYVTDLRRHYPLETAEQLLRSARKKPAVTKAPAEKPVSRVEKPVSHVEKLVPRQDDSDLKLYRQKEKSAPVSPPTPPAAPQRKRAALTPALPLPVGWTRPTLNGKSHPVEVPLPTSIHDEDKASAMDYWAATLLLVLMVAAGTGLVAYLLVSPFWGL